MRCRIGDWVAVTRAEHPHNHGAVGQVIEVGPWGMQGPSWMVQFSRSRVGRSAKDGRIVSALVLPFADTFLRPLRWQIGEDEVLKLARRMA